jgi:TonB family protein
MKTVHIPVLILLLAATAHLSAQTQAPSPLSKGERIRLCEKKIGVPLEAGPEPLKIEGDIVRPKPLRQVVSGAFKGVQATVVVEGVVDEDGCMRQVRAVQSTDKKLEAPAIEAAKKWVFEPATRNGVPVRVLYPITTNGITRGG